MASSTKTRLTEARAHLGAAAAVLAAAALVYANTIDAPFTFDDDLHLVEGSPMARSVAAALAACGGQNRCVGFATFAANYAVGGLEVRGYHLVNLVVHALAGLLVYALGVLLARTPRLVGAALAPRARLVALGAALLFVVHPLQTMAVTYVVQRFASLMALFYLAAVVAWLAARLSPVSAARVPLFLGSLAAAVLAMKTKENALTLPIALVLVELLFFEGPAWPRLARLAPWGLTVVLPLAATFAGDGGLDAALRANSEQTRLGYAATQLTVIPAYLRLLAWPVGQSVDHHPPLFDAPWQAAPLAGGALLLVLLMGAGRAVWRARGDRSGQWLVGFGVFWFFLTLSVESSVVPIGDVMVEHRLYLPSAGLFLAVAALWALAVERLRAARPWAGRAAGGLAVAAVLGLAVAAAARNEVWRDEPRLWREASALAPGAWRPFANTGQALLERGQCAEALPYLEAAHERDRTVLEPLLNLGLCHATLGDRARARQRFEEALALAPRDGRAPAQLARLASEDGDLITARALYERALALRPGDAEVRAGLGATLGQLGLLDEARTHLERAALEAPCSAVAWGNLGNVRLLQADERGAEEAWRRALGCDPADAAARENLARLLGQQGTGAPP